MIYNKFYTYVNPFRLNSTVFIEYYNALGKAFCTREGFGIWISNKHIIFGEDNTGTYKYVCFIYTIAYIDFN